MRFDAVKKRVLVVIRHPVGGIRTHILYTYPYLLESGYRFTFVGPADESFEYFRHSVESWEESEFIEAPIERRKCKLWATVRKLLKDRKFDLIHSHGLTAGVQSVLANIGIGRPHIITSHKRDSGKPIPRHIGLS